MENLRKENHVVPTGDLLSEMDALEIHGGMSGGENNPDAVYVFCNGAKCVSACDTGAKDASACATYVFCGSSTPCVS